MIKRFFGRSDEVLSEYQRAGGELGVFTLALVGVVDCFDPDPLWDRRYGGGVDIKEKVTGDGEFRLQSALDGCRNSVFARDDAGRFREQNPVFTDIVMWIPATEWRTESMRGGQRLEALGSNLAVLHGNKFRGSLQGDREPIYTIMPDEALAEDEVVFQFGFGVFVPNNEDVQMATISMRRGDNKDALELPEWSFWHQGAQIKRPAGVYKGQKSILIAPNADGPVRAPVWFERKDGHILINLNAADSERIYADEEFLEIKDKKLPKKKTDPFEWSLKARVEKGETEPTGLEIVVVQLTPLPGAIEESVKIAEKAKEKKLEEKAGEAKAEPKKDRKEPKKDRKEKAAQPTPAGETESRGRLFGLERLLPAFSRSRDRGGKGEPTPLSSRYSLRLAGLALMRIDGRHRLGGLLDWTVFFNDDGQPVSYEQADTVNATTCLALQANNRDGRLYYRLTNEKSFKPVAEMPCVLPTGNKQYLELVPPPVPDRYLGVLFLREEITFPLSPKPLVLGRSNLDPQAAQPDLPLEMLTHPESLHWAAGSGYPGAKLNAINLSRRHVSFKLKGGDLDMEMEEGTAPVYVLNDDGSLQHSVEPKSTHRVAIRPGQTIIAGSYLLRFHEEKTRVMASAEHSVLRRKAGA